MKVGIYNRYWSTMGGGEKHVGTIAEVLLSEGYEVDLIRVGPVDEVEFCQRMNLKLDGARWVDWPAQSCAELAPRSADYDLFINSTYCSSMVSQAARSIYLVFFPHELVESSRVARFLQRAAGKLSREGFPRFGRIANNARKLVRGHVSKDLRPFIDSYDVPLANSEFTAAWVEKRWARKADVLPPPIDTERFAGIELDGKKRVILSVGRFFAGGHNKKHVELIGAFRGMCDAGMVPEGWEYHLAGSVHADTAAHREYFERVNELARGCPIRIMGNLTARELLEEYSMASIFWHGAGWGESETIEPEKLEHFGMTACEAMAAGAIPIVVPMGGPKEIVTDGVDGFHFRSADDLRLKTRDLMALYGTGAQIELAERARQSVAKYSNSSFRNGFMKIMRRR
ncbi:glycosyltransferase family 4 protein [Stenotrophomonas maltophilia]|nr:glycosyltransferase family 4 protein [Stenotrophomonas maltophilia]